jgi:predicted RNase H-like HicB family nuclease
MTETIALEINLQAYVRRETAQRWIATCPHIGVVTQGESSSDARRCLQEAVELWFESCIERGVLDQALREANFRPSVSSFSRKESSSVSRSKRQSSVLGEPFAVHLTVPGYEAPSLLGATA